MLLAYERKKNDQLVRTLRLLKHENSHANPTTNNLSEDFINNLMKAEMTDADVRVPDFCAYADNIFKEAWISHYSDFNPNTPLLSHGAILEMHQKIEAAFPMHHACLKSMIYGKCSHQASRANTKYNLEKRDVLVHYFFASCANGIGTIWFIGLWWQQLHCIILVWMQIHIAMAKDDRGRLICKLRWICWK